MILVITDEPGDGGGGVLGAGAGAADRAPDRLADGLDLDDVLLDHRIRRQRFDRVVLDAVAAADLRDSCSSLTAVELMSTPISGGWLFVNRPTVSPLPTGAYAQFVRRYIK